MPSYFTSFEQACPNLQGALDNLWATGRSPGADDRMPTAEFLVSPANRKGIVAEILPGRGKIKTVEVRYRPRGLESAVLEDQANPNCTATGYYGNNITEYTIDPDQNLQIGEAIPVDANELACMDNAEYFAEKLAWHIDVMDRRVATELNTQAVALTGGWGATIPHNGIQPGQVNFADQLVIATLLSGGATLDPKGWTYLRNALEDSGFPSDVYIAGGGVMRTYLQQIMAGCCGDNGIDLGAIMAQYGYAFAYDKRTKNALGSDSEFLVLSPGALQVLAYTRAEGKAAFGTIWNSSSNYLYTTVASPRLGLPYDLTVKDDCGTLNMTLTATVKTIGMPTDMFAIGDDYHGITYAAQGIVTNP